MFNKEMFFFDWLLLIGVGTECTRGFSRTDVLILRHQVHLMHIPAI